MLPPLATRFIAGETASDAISNTADARASDVGTIFNLLGEHYSDPADAEADADAYITLIDDLADTSATCISVKPSQLGGDIAPEVLSHHVERIVEHAHDRDVFVWVDMEDHSTVDDTLTIVETVGETYPGSVGVCLQANLKRTPDDIDRLSGTGVCIRLVKGAYNEPAEVAHQSAETIDDKYKALMHGLVTDFDGDIALGTHDPEMIARAKDLAEVHNREIQFQMLLGVREQAQRNLAAEGYDVWQYAPYGTRWPAYVWRRIREGRKNMKFILRALLSRS